MVNDEAGVNAGFAFTTGLEIAGLDLKTRLVKEEKRLLDMSFFRIQDRELLVRIRKVKLLSHWYQLIGCTDHSWQS